MNICIHETVEIMGARSAELGADAIRRAIAARGAANIILATGASQFSTLASLVKQPDIDWSKVTCFHLDEYVGMSETHKASFRKYLRERFAEKVPALKEFVYVAADAPDLKAELARLSQRIRKQPIDVAFIGIGENGHIAFNDPPADFETEAPYIVVDLDEKCRLQQVGEGWFKSLDEVPAQAVSMSIRHILKSALIVCSVPDQRKAAAVEMALNAPISPSAPCSILRRHPDCYLMLDKPAASLILKSR
jgi:glucosamine-6-phosphate deaminase